MGLLGVTVLFVLLQFVATQDAGCDFSETMVAGRTYYIYSPGYPNNYTGARQCRWVRIAPAGYTSRLDCPEIQLPASQGCSRDRLLISRSGDLQLAGADVYCGRGSTTAVSTGQRMSIGLITPFNTIGGRFYCEMRAQPSTTTPPCSCGYKKTNRIVGGVETGVNEYPMMAGILDLRISSLKCGGTIIARRYVMTAAHCVIGRAIDELAVVVGEHDTSTGGETSASQGIALERITPHPQFTSSNYDYDIAILRLARDIVFTDRVGPACLPFKYANSDFNGAYVTLLGWGTLCPGCPTSNTLQKVDVQVVSQNTCRSVVSTVTPRQMCTYSRGKDACQDDSGGPVLFAEPSTGTIYGIGCISFGNFCATEGQPGINTRVTALLPWIMSVSRDADYCMK